MLNLPAKSTARHATRALTLLLAALAPAGASWAQDYPSKPVRIVIPYAPGGATDIQARILADNMTRLFNQPVIAENRPGASGVTGSEMVARATPDGHTLLVGSSASHAVNAAVMSNLSYDPVKDFSHISLLTTIPNVIVAHPSFEADTVPKLIAYLKANPGTTYGTAGPTSSGRFAAELLALRLGVKMTMVPYKGAAPAMADMVGGHLKLSIVDITPAVPLMQAGKLRGIALTGRTRSALFPDLPTLDATAVKGFEGVAWLAFFAPRGTPAPILNRMSAVTREIFFRPAIKASLEQQGSDVVASSPAELAAFVESEVRKWTDLARANNIKGE